MTNADAMDETIAAVPDLDPALARMARGLAAAVDADPANAALWREYRATVAAVKDAAAHVNDDDTAEFLLAVSSVRRTPIRDS